MEKHWENIKKCQEGKRGQDGKMEKHLEIMKKKCQEGKKRGVGKYSRGRFWFKGGMAGWEGGGGGGGVERYVHNNYMCCT
jgi:hypothetical protein